MANDIRVFIFVKELFGTAKCHLVNIFINLFCGHTNTTVSESLVSFSAASRYINAQFAQIAFRLTN
jgi:hypothetical protein